MTQKQISNYITLAANDEFSYISGEELDIFLTNNASWDSYFLDLSNNQLNHREGGE